MSLPKLVKKYLAEWGLTSLDALDMGNAPAWHGENWHNIIRSFHLRVGEHQGYRLKWYDDTDPENFRFGTGKIF